MHAFAACECGRLDEARELIERSLTAFPQSAHGAHVKAHVLHEMGEPAACLEFLEAWMPSFDRRGLLHCHLSWHVALSALALGKREHALEVYHSCIRPGAAWGPPLNVVTDSAAFLWRMELAGEPRRTELWREVRDYALRCFPKAGVPFADVHTAVACVANEDFAALEKLAGDMQARLDAGNLAPGRVVPTLTAAFASYAKNDWTTAIRLLEEALPETVRIGGSRAQRDLVEYTLLAAYFKAGKAEEANALVARRSRASIRAAELKGFAA
jgi:tetratricopeptide (TPR) repeat protein